MQQYIAFDSHKKYTLAERFDPDSGRCRQQRIEHTPGAIEAYLTDTRPGTPVALEAIGSWYWIVEEIERAGCRPMLVNPYKAKLMMGQTNKSDRLDVHGLNLLQRSGTLPTVWVPPARLRDLRELTRTRLSFTRDRTRAKNRIHATLAKYNLRLDGVSDIFGQRGRQLLEAQLQRLPRYAHMTITMMLQHLDELCAHIRTIEVELQQLLTVTPEMQRIKSLPGVGTILAATIALEVGPVDRFGSAGRLAAYAGTTPRLHASGGKIRHGRLRHDVNRTLKWAFAEAANSVAVNHTRHPQWHVSQLYRRIRGRKGHAVAVGAVARHLAEACYHVLNNKEAYREPATCRRTVESGRRQRDSVMSR